MSQSMNFILTRTVVISWTTPSFVSHPSVSNLAEPCRITFLNIILYCNVQLNKYYFHRKTFSKILKFHIPFWFFSLYYMFLVQLRRVFRTINNRDRPRDPWIEHPIVERFVDSWIGVGNSGSTSSKKWIFWNDLFLKIITNH